MKALVVVVLLVILPLVRCLGEDVPEAAAAGKKPKKPKAKAVEAAQPQGDCRLTFTVPAEQMMAHCSMASQAQGLTQQVKQEVGAMRAENAALKADLAAVKQEYQDMVDTVKKLEQETASWRETISWPLLDKRFRPDNASLIVKESPTYKDCTDVRNQGNSKLGIYVLEPEGAQVPFFAFCDKDGWTVIQRRFDGSVDFYKNWDDYTAGFGELSGEFWLGLENIHLLTQQGDYELKVEAMGQNNKLYHALYEDFSLGSETTEFTLQVGNFTEGNYVDVLGPLNGYAFSTRDKDNDGWYAGNCAEYYRGAFWMDNCGGDLNRLWCEGYGCMSWGERAVKKSVMKIRQAGQGGRKPKKPKRTG